MNKERLLKLADFLDQLPPQKFDFSVIAIEKRKPMLAALAARGEACGTVACAMGWCPAVFPELVEWTHKGDNAFRSWLDIKPVDFSKLSLPSSNTGYGISHRTAAALFEISLAAVDYLFDPNGSEELPVDPTPKEVAEHICRFVELALEGVNVIHA